MPKKSMAVLTESMFYVLMAFACCPMCGIDIACFVEKTTRGRVKLGPATLYTILGKFQQERYIEETDVEGRKRTYRLTEKGREAYQTELDRLQSCLRDAENQQRKGRNDA